jgi:hypothetical protein
VQLDALMLALNVPLMHGSQVRSMVALPSWLTLFPSGQFLRGAHSVPGASSWSHIPLGQTSPGVSPPGQKVPASQGLHCAGSVSVAGSICSVPGSHAPGGRHSLWFSMVD